MTEILWTPSEERAAKSQMQDFAREASQRTGLDLSEFAALHRWSVDEADAFWALVWEMCDVIGERGERFMDRDRVRRRMPKIDPARRTDRTKRAH